MNQEPARAFWQAPFVGRGGAGLLLAVALAVLLFVASGWMGAAQDAFQAGMVFVAPALIVQMVLWMRAHGRTLEARAGKRPGRAPEQANWWG